MKRTVDPTPSSSLPLPLETDGGNASPLSSRQPPPRRNRDQLSCTHCRHAKLKCDRNQPCWQCVKRGRESLCVFPPPVTKRKQTVSMQNRLKHLQSLLKDVIAGQAPVGQPSPPGDGNGDRIASDLDPEISNVVTCGHNELPQTLSSINCEDKDEPPPSMGQVLLGTNQTTYVGATHWAAIIDDVEEIHSYFEETEADFIADDSIRPDMSLVFRPGSRVTKHSLIAALPQRGVVDRLVSRYFNSNSPALHIIHHPTFQKEYKKFWADPSGTPTSWLGLLYALMCLATLAAFGAGEENPDTRGSPAEMIRTYRGCCAQCLVLSNYSQPGAYTLEALLIYIEGEFILSKDDQGVSYLLIGNAMRLALRMGLHRDPAKVGGNMTPFQGELRRRLWHLVVQIDLLSSFHLGLPVMTQGFESDTSFPRNLRDEDFDESSTELPPSRPETERTPMSYTICKSRICEVFGKVGFLANRLSLPSYDEVMALDRLLYEVEAQVPEFLRLKPLELSITDSAMLIIQRFSLALLLQKSRCMLHRKHLTKESYSKRVAVEAAMELLSYQSSVHEAALPGGPLAQNRWFLSSLSMHDFLLAAMIVYFSLAQLAEGSHSKSRSPSNEVQLSYEDMVTALQKSHSVWTNARTTPANADKASRILGVMLKNANLVAENVAGSKNDGLVGDMDRTSAMPGNSQFISQLSINDSARPSFHSSVDENYLWNRAMTDTMQQSSGYGLQLDVDSQSTLFEPIETMMDMPTNFDWEVFDNHVRPGPPQYVPEQVWPDLDFDGLG